MEPITHSKHMCIIKNLFSLEECKKIIELSENEGYDPPETFCYKYNRRKNHRMMKIDQDLSSKVFYRLLPHLPENLPGGWELHRCNELWRFCKYDPGHFFGSHWDGEYRPSISERSFFSCTIYLNSDFVGGELLLEPSGRKSHKWVPEAGSAVIFKQKDPSAIHSGRLLKKGQKYITRTDVMYRYKKPASRASLGSHSDAYQGL